ncbi:hypothetical protein SAMN05444000_103214 [Shimia gijangensis]|uniref:Uncharacterized protein n=1 Tax=Shimia gijangensis TaxID=1470563 RepID=A0A1M6EID7_9RHOB|nr:hypothetical protein [Shimia gijangensis]SHI85245.1 hypothetical protein SAMN05444000_103214 [Shimia gijangensis]
MQWKGFITGVLVGGLTVGSIYFLSDIASLFIQGPKVTELVLENEVLKQENAILHGMTEANWVGMTTQEATKQLTALGLTHSVKGADGITTGSIYLKLTDGQVAKIQAHCAPPAPAGCATQGVN